MAKFRPAPTGCFGSPESARAGFLATLPDGEQWLEAGGLATVGRSVAMENVLLSETERCFKDLVLALLTARAQLEQLRIFDVELPNPEKAKPAEGREFVARAIQKALTVAGVAYLDLLNDGETNEEPEAQARRAKAQARAQRRRRLHRSGHSQEYERRFGIDVELSIGGTKFPSAPRDQWLAVMRWWARQLGAQGRYFPDLGRGVDRVAMLAVCFRADRLDEGIPVRAAEARLRDRWKKISGRVIRWERGKTGHSR